MDDNILNQSLEALEKDYWHVTEFPTRLVEKCFYARKKKLKELDLGELRILMTQQIGLRYIVPLSLELLQNDILLDSDFYPGDLLEAILKLPSTFWTVKENSILRNRLIELLGFQIEDIKSSSKISEEIKSSILNSYSEFKKFR